MNEYQIETSALSDQAAFQLSRRSLVATAGTTLLAGCGKRSSESPPPTSKTPASTATTSNNSLIWPQFQHDTLNSGQTSPVSSDQSFSVSWRDQAEKPVNGSPVIGPERAYVITNDGTVLALRLSDGQRAWTQALPAVSGPTTPALSIDNGLLYCLDGTGTLHGLATADGATQWTTDLDPSREVLRAGPTVAGNRIYATTERLNAVSAESGDLLWTGASGRDELLPAPTVIGNRIAVGRVTGELRILDKAGNTTFSGSFASGASVALTASEDGQLIQAGLDGELRAFSADEETTTWEAVPSDMSATVSVCPTCDGELIYVGANDGTFAALSMADGSETWARSFDFQIATDPAADTESVYLGVGGTLTALDRATGETQWRVDTNSPILSAIAKDSDGFVVGMSDGSVVRIR